MAASVETPEITGKIEIPHIKPGATAHLKTKSAESKHMEALGFPGQLVEGWHDKAIGKMGELLDKNKALRVFLDTCIRCGACTDKCHYYLGTQDPKNMPVARQDLFRKVYRKHFTFSGKLLGKWVGAEDLTEDVLKDWWSYFHQCSQCRRCSVFCPMGIDTAEISMAARDVMDSIGMGQHYCNEIIGKVHNVGNNLGIPQAGLQSTLEFLEEDVLEATGVPVKFPMNQENVEVLLVTPSADFFSSPHVDSLVGYAKVFHAAGISWTVSDYASEFANFGMFIGSYEHLQRIAQRILDTARKLNVKRIVVGECGHAWRVGYSFWNTLIGPFDFLDQRYPIPQHICEFTYDLYRRGVVRFDKSKNDHYVVTMHDSCNVARGAGMGPEPGGQFEIPRALIRACCNHFVEMDPNTTKEKTFCCGGGGGLLTDDLIELRVKGAMPRVQALKAVMDSNKVNFMAMICAICKAQFTRVLPEYKLDREIVGGIHQLVSNAIVLEGQKTE